MMAQTKLPALSLADRAALLLLYICHLGLAMLPGFHQAIGCGHV
jgi:hypothetical protein